MRVVLAAVGVLGVAACLKIPDHTPGGDAGTGDGRTSDADPREPLVGVTTTGNPSTGVLGVHAEEYAVTFPFGTAYRFPDEIVVGGISVLGGGSMCPAEHGLGIALLNAFSINSRQNTAVPSTVALVAAGPAYAQVAVSWQHDFDCPTTTTADGTTTFTFFPDGRIIRFDQVATQLITDFSGTCGCTTNPSPVYLDSYITFSDGAFESITWASYDIPSDEQSTVVPPGMWIDNENPVWACIGDRDDAVPSAPTRRVGVAWTGLSGNNTYGTVLKPAGSTSTLFAFTWDYGVTVLGAAERTASSALFLNDGPDASCDLPVMQPLAQAFDTPPLVTITPLGGALQNVTLDQSTGIYTRAADPSPPTYYTIAPLTALAPGHAISLELPTGDPAIAEIGATTLVDGVDYRVQVQQISPLSYRHTFWFRDGLTPTPGLVLRQ